MHRYPYVEKIVQCTKKLDTNPFPHYVPLEAQLTHGLWAAYREVREMDQQIMIKQMISFNKSAFENTFNAMALLQDQMEKMSSTFLDQATWVPEEGKKVIDEWVTTYKKSREEFKSAVEGGFAKVEAYFEGEKKKSK